MPKDNDGRLFLNPRMDKEMIKDFEQNILNQKQENDIKLDKSKLIRAFVKKFNSNPSEMLDYLEIN